MWVRALNSSKLKSVRESKPPFRHAFRQGRYAIIVETGESSRPWLSANHSPFSRTETRTYHLSRKRQAKRARMRVKLRGARHCERHGTPGAAASLSWAIQASDNGSQHHDQHAARSSATASSSLAADRCGRRHALRRMCDTSVVIGCTGAHTCTCHQHETHADSACSVACRSDGG